MLPRRRFWRRRKPLILAYATIALGASGLALAGSYVLWLSLIHTAHQPW